MAQPIIQNWENLPHPTAFSGIGAVSRHYLMPTNDAKDILAGSNTYTTHREPKKVKVFNPYFVYSKRNLIQIDLIDIPDLSDANNGSRYILVAIDSFSRKVVVRLLKSKSADVVTRAFKQIIQRFKRRTRENIEKVLSDHGAEFKNRQFRALMQEYHINHILTSNHAGTAERIIRSIQSLMYKYMARYETRKYIDVLPDIIKSINNRYHRIIKMTPNEAEMDANYDLVLDNLSTYYNRTPSIQKFNIGDRVRMKRQKAHFERGYDQTFTEEQFRIRQIHSNKPVHMYSLSEWDGTPLIGTFYAHELQKVTAEEAFKVNQQLRRRIRRGIQEVFVSWKGWPDKYNSWIPAAQLQPIRP